MHVIFFLIFNIFNICICSWIKTGVLKTLNFFKAKNEGNIEESITVLLRTYEQKVCIIPCEALSPIYTIYYQLDWVNFFFKV